MQKKFEVISEVVGDDKMITIFTVSQLKKNFFKTLFFHHYLENIIVLGASILTFLCINTTKCLPGITAGQDIDCK